MDEQMKDAEFRAGERVRVRPPTCVAYDRLYEENGFINSWHKDMDHACVFGEGVVKDIDENGILIEWTDVERFPFRFLPSWVEKCP